MKAVHRVLDPTISNPSLRRRCALAVMTKAPRAGQVKTRLVPPLTAEEAAALNRCFLRDTAAAISRACGENAQAIAVYTPLGAEAVYADILPNHFELVPQRGHGFGERLGCAIDDLFRIGFQSVCLIDSDSPMVPAEVYRKAANLLSAENEHIVLGPSDDGGYYLIGLKKMCPRLFEEIDWSSSRVLDQTIQRAGEVKLEVRLLARCYDVDDHAGLARLCNELFERNATSTSDVAVETRRFLSEIIAREGRDRIWPM